MKTRITIEYIPHSQDELSLKRLIENQNAAIDIHNGLTRNARVPGLKYPVQIIAVELEKPGR